MSKLDDHIVITYNFYIFINLQTERSSPCGIGLNMLAHIPLWSTKKAHDLHFTVSMRLYQCVLQTQCYYDIKLLVMLTA